MTLVTRGSPEPDRALSVVLNDDGYYWFLYPHFQRLHERTSQMIDLYGDAEFTGDQLLEVKQIIAEACSLIRQQPATWLVHIGTQTHPIERELSSEVEKATFLNVIEHVQAMIEYAIQYDGTIVCLGD